ncbi:serpin family protein [Endozoicomonas sp. 8E]|uniref:serpin family protein n=1 Tax=Endozoicomonas sp. 8E TaxID=3035692 RepID=UPI002938E18A|nr:serpin family protein [Endozoicomonas sp. 8E]WOG25599.1 serpin family protein [Endozoicomonas sp. 8E]
MFLLGEPSGSICQYTFVLVLLCLFSLLLLPSQPLAITCDSCGRDYDEETFSSCPTPSCNKENEGEFPQHGTAPPQGATPVNLDLNPGAQVDKSETNFDFAMHVFYKASANIPGNFVISPDSLFQTVALLLLNARDKGTDEQFRQIYMGGKDSEPSGAAASGATDGGQDKNPFAIIMLAANQSEALATYRERLKQVDHSPGNADCSHRADTQSLDQLLNRLFCQLTHGIIQDYCTRDAYPFKLSLTIELASSFYFVGMWRESSETDNAYLFTLPNDQAVALERIIKGKTNPSQYARHNNWNAFTFPYREDHEMILILPPPGGFPYVQKSEIISALISSFDSEEPFSSSSTTTPEVLLSNVDTNTDLSEAIHPSGSGLLSVVTSDLSSGAMPTLSFGMNAFSKQEAPDAALSNTGSHRTHEGDAVQSIRFDRPFLYILRNKITKRINLIGRYFFPPDSGTSSSGSSNDKSGQGKTS